MSKWHVYSRFKNSLVLTVFLIFGQSLQPVYADEIFLPLVRSQAELVVAAASDSKIIVQLAPGTDLVELSNSYQAATREVIPALAVYELQSSDPELLTKVSADPRVVWAMTDKLITAVDPEQRTYDPANGDFEMLQRYFGFGSADANPRIGAEERALIVKSKQDFDVTWKTWGMRKTKANQAQIWATGAGVVVAVLDTGVDLDHPLLLNRLAPGYDFVEDDALPDDLPNALDEDQDGKTDEGTGHGTHVAGIISAVAAGAKIMPVRVLNSDGAGTLQDITQGIIYAVDNGADVINLSLRTTAASPLLETAIAYAQLRHVVVVAAANGTATMLDYPAAYASVISVGATRIDDKITDFSLNHAALTDVFAPGELIYSTYYGGGFAWWSGASMAAPFVAGEAALLLEKGTCSVDCVIATIGREVASVSPEQNPRGRSDMMKAVRSVLP